MIPYCLHGTIDLPRKGVIYKHRFKSHTQKCLSLDMEHRLCFPFCQGHYGRMQSHRQEIQFEMSYNLQSTINHTPLNSTLPLLPTHTHTHTHRSSHQCTSRHVLSMGVLSHKGSCVYTHSATLRIECAKVREERRLQLNYPQSKVITSIQ